VTATTGEPVRPVTRSWALRFNLAWLCIMIGLFGPIQILLPNQAATLAPDAKEAALGVVSAVGAALSLVANPLWGALSDRTVSRFGRRLPWIVIGGVAGAAGLLVLAAAPSLPVMILGWALVQTAVNAPWAALTAAVPDQVPPAQRGSVSGYLGLAQLVGVLVATGLATLVPGPAGYVVCAAVMLLGLVPFVVGRRDEPETERPPAWHWGSFLRGFWVSPRQHPDFGWAWLTRFLINLGYCVGTVYLLYFLRDVIGSEHAEADLLLVTVVSTASTGVAVVVSGRWSDRLDRRRIFVSTAGVVMAVGALLMAVAPTWGVLLVVAAVLGVGFGVFTAVDFSLITLVLPDVATMGKDMGVLNIANSLPQVLAPALAAPIVVSPGGYPALFAVSALLCLAGALLVRRVRSVQ
jgi:MFS family permease